MKKTDFSHSGGFPLEQTVLDRMQDGFIEVLKAFVNQLGCADTGNYIIYGCTISGPNITPGMLYIDGELCPFAGAVGTLATKIKKTTTTANAAFENGTNPPVFIETTATIHASGTALSGFTRFYYVNDQNYLPYTLAEQLKLASIEPGAQVNVKPSWTAPEADPNGIEDKPPGNLQTYLAKGNVIIGDILGATDVRTIPLGIDVGTDEYHVDGNLTGTFVGTDDGEASVSFITKRKTNISFDIIIYDPRNRSSQNFEFDYNITPL